MSDEPEDLTLRQLKELCSEMLGLQAEIREMMIDLAKRLDSAASLPNVVAVIALNRENRLRRSKKRER